MNDATSYICYTDTVQGVTEASVDLIVIPGNLHHKTCTISTSTHLWRLLNFCGIWCLNYTALLVCWPVKLNQNLFQRENISSCFTWNDLGWKIKIWEIASYRQAIIGSRFEGGRPLNEHFLKFKLKSSESPKWPIAVVMHCGSSVINIFLSRTTGPIWTKFVIV